jgi:type IV pilus assembly protein PilP
MMKIATLLLTFFPMACIPTESSLIDYINRVKASPVKPVAVLPHFQTDPIRFVPLLSNQRSPFASINELNVSQGGKDAMQSNPLEHFPLDALHLVGTLTNETGTFGLVLQPDGQIIRVAEGDTIGRHHGMILHITKDALEIEETKLVDQKIIKQKTVLISKQHEGE